TEALQWRTKEQARLAGQQAAVLGRQPDARLAAELDVERRNAGAHDMIVFAAGGGILAAGFANNDPTLPAETPPQELKGRLAGQPYGSTETLADGRRFLVSVAVPIPEPGRAPRRFLLARHELPRDLAEMLNVMQQMQHSYANAQEWRMPLKYNF